MYSAAYTSQTRGQKRFTISEQVAADWREVVIPQRTMRRPLPVLANNWTRGFSQQTYHRLSQPHYILTP